MGKTGSLANFIFLGTFFLGIKMRENNQRYCNKQSWNLNLYNASPKGKRRRIRTLDLIFFFLFFGTYIIKAKVHH